MHSIVNVRDVSFEVSGGRLLFENINFTLESKLTALVGPNGVGKTCLAKLISGEHEPSHGEIRRFANISFFPQREVPRPISVNEYLVHHYEWSLLKDKLLASIDRESLCTHLSGGQWMRVRLAKAMNDQFLILDEPTNDLDREGREAVLEFLGECPNGALLISHDRECLRFCETILELSNQGLSKFSGDWHSYERDKEREIESRKNNLDLATRKRDQTEMDRQEKISQQEKRNRRGVLQAQRGGIPKILLGARKRRAQVTTGQVAAATLDEANLAVRDAATAYNELKLSPMMYAEISGSAIPNQKLVAEASHFNARFKDWIYKENLQFSWRGNIRLALKGKNGSGKSTLLKFLLGQCAAETQGEFRSGSLQTLYIDQRGETLDDSTSVLENVRETSHLDESEVRNHLAQFLFAKDSVFQKVSSLSGGERLRASLAKGLLSHKKPELLILDEPTNNLDLKNIEFLEDLIREFKAALIIVSHDEIFLENCNIKEIYEIVS